MEDSSKEGNVSGGQGPLKCWERMLNSVLCASNDPQIPKKTWRRKCLDCLKPTDDESQEQGTSDTPKRETWGSRCTFFMTTLGMSVGLGQVWRFPVLAYTYGGGVFLLLYGLFLFSYGNVIFFFEVINGQYSSKNPLRVFDKVPLFIGTGWCMIMYAFLFCTYYNHMVSFSLLYLFSTFTARLPWSYCPENENDIFDSVACLPLAKLREPKMDGIVCGNSAFIYNITELCSNSTYAQDQKSKCCYEAKVEEGSSCDGLFNVTDLCRHREFPSSYFWSHTVTKSFREDDPSFGYLGEPIWPLLGFSCLAWFMAYAALYKGIKSLGVIMYILVPLPYIVLFIMFGIAMPQEGAVDGLKAFFIPEPSAFLDPNVWRVASEQAFYSVGVAMGPLITFGSYSKFDSPSHVDCALICLCIFLTSVVSGSVVFSVLGFLAAKSGQDFSKVVLPGPGLVFIVYPEALDLLPGAQFFCFLFYLMLINLGLSSVTGIIETVPSAIYDVWPITRRFKYLVNLAVLFSAFLIGVPITYRGGLNFYNSFDTFSAGMTLIPICIVEMSVVVYIYGIGRFCEDINFMLGFYPNRFYRWQWLVGPFSLLVIFLYGLITIELPPMRFWQKFVGGFLFLLVMVWIPVGMVYMLIKYGRKKDLKNVLKPPPDHGPKNPENFEARKEFTVKRKIF